MTTKNTRHHGTFKFPRNHEFVTVKTEKAIAHSVRSEHPLNDRVCRKEPPSSTPSLWQNSAL